MKIISGSLKGKRISAKVGKGLRPTSAKVREACFDILGAGVKGANFLDLYAGTGTVGFEALSRGSAGVLFVDISDSSIKAIRAQPLFAQSPLNRAINGKASTVLKKLDRDGETFGIVFVDPPYGSEEIDVVLPILGSGTGGLLDEGAVVVVEHFFKRPVPEAAGCLVLRRSYRYGDTMLSFYEATAREVPADGA